MAEEDQDKTEQATPFKLREARKRGQLAKSMEMNSFLILGVVLFLSYMIGYQVFDGFMKVNAKIFSHAGQIVFSESPIMLLYEIVLESVIGVFGILIAAVMITSIMSNLVQIGPVFSLQPIKPDIQRLNPVSGIKRVFSMRMLFEFIKTVIKISVLSTVVYFSIKALLPDLMGLITVSTKQYGYLLLDYSNGLFAKLLAVLFFVALIDIAFTKKDYSKKMMMSRRELKDEVKRREGDPRVKSKLRELQKEAAKRTGSIKKVSDADVLITNPTHLAVAIAYKRETMFAPTVLAKGAGEMAGKMKMFARKNNIPIFEDKPLARDIFRKVEIDGVIPETHYRAVAKLLVIAQRLKQNISQ